MSVKVMSYVWDIPLFKGSDKLVMLCLADHADDSGLCWPSIDTIARKSGVSPTTVKSTLKKLEVGGWIAKRNQFKRSETGRLVRSNNQYQLPVLLLRKKADEQTDFEQTDFVRSKLEHSKFEQTKQDRGVGQVSTGGRSESGYKPSIDPPIDPSGTVPSQLETGKPAEPVLFKIPLNRKGTYHDVTESDLAEWRDTYPAVDVAQQVRQMIAWCDAKPQRRKTARGIKSFIHGWLCREQDRGYVAMSGAPVRPPKTDRDKLRDQIRQLEMDINNENQSLVRARQWGATPMAIEASESRLTRMQQEHAGLKSQLRGMNG